MTEREAPGVVDHTVGNGDFIADKYLL